MLCRYFNESCFFWYWMQTSPLSFFSLDVLVFQVPCPCHCTLRLFKDTLRPVPCNLHGQFCNMTFNAYTLAFFSTFKPSPGTARVSCAFLFLHGDYTSCDAPCWQCSPFALFALILTLCFQKLQDPFRFSESEHYFVKFSRYFGDVQGI